MSRSLRAAMMGATAVACHLAATPYAIAQQQPAPATPAAATIPPVVVQEKKPAKRVAKPAPKPKARPATPPVAAAQPSSQSAPVAEGPAQAGVPSDSYDTSTGRSDLNPGSPTNFARLAQSSSSHSETITRRQIEQLRPRDVFDLVNNATSVIETQGGRKGFSGLTIRGDNKFIWILDGAYLQPTMASRIMRAIPVNIVEQVTIVRGSAALTLAPLVASAQAGGAPVDGFIVVRTRRPKKLEAEVVGAIESNETYKASGWAGNRVKHGDGTAYVAAAVSHASSDGPDDLLNNGASYNRGYRVNSGLAKMGFDVSGWSVNLTAFKDRGQYEIPNANSHGPGQGNWFVKPSETTLVSLNATRTWSPVHTTIFNASRVESEQTLVTPTANYNPNYLTNVNLRHNIDLESLRFSFGGNFMHWNAPNGQQYYEGIQREEKTYGGFGQVEKKFFGDRLTIDGAIRYDRVHVLHGLDYYTGGAQPVGGVNSPLRTEDVTLPLAKFYDLGASFRVVENWKLTSRIGMSSQASSGLQPMPGVTLDDDSVLKMEAGIEGRVNRWFAPAVNFFHREAQNEKQLAGYTYTSVGSGQQNCRAGSIPANGPFRPTPNSTFIPCYNQNDTTRQGIEVTVTGQLWQGGSYKANFTHYTNLKNASEITPHNMAGITLSQNAFGFLLTGAAKYVAPYKGSASDPAAYLGGYTRFDAGIGREFKFDEASIRGTLYGRNLTDRRYETTNGIQDIGRVIGFELLARY